MKKIIFLLLVMGFIFSLSYADTPINGVVATPVGVSAVVGDGGLPHADDANINVLWSEASMTLMYGSGSMGNIVGGSGENVKLNFAIRFPHELLASVRAHDMVVKEIWAFGSDRYGTVRNLKMTPHLFSGVKLENERIEKMAMQDTFAITVGDLSKPPQWSGQTQNHPVSDAGTDKWYGWVVPDTCGAIEVGDELWAVITVEFGSSSSGGGYPFGANAAGSGLEMFYVSTVPVASGGVNEGKFMAFYDYNCAENQGENYTRENSTAPWILTGPPNPDWEEGDDPADEFLPLVTDTYTFIIELELGYPALAGDDDGDGDGKGRTITLSSMDTSRPKMVNDPDFVPVERNFPVFNDSRLADPTVVVPGKFAGFRVYHNDDATPVMDVDDTPTPNASGVYTYVDVDPANNAFHTYGVVTVIDISTDSTPEYVESAPVYYNLNKGNPLVPLPWQQDVVDHNPIPAGLRAMWRFDNSLTKFYAGDELIATPNTALNNLKTNWSTRAQTLYTAPTTVGFFRTASPVGTAFNGLPAVLNATRVEVENWLISPALTYPTTAEIGSDKVYLVYNYNIPAAVTEDGDYKQVVLEIYMGETNVMSEMTLVETAPALTVINWVGRSVEVPAILGLTDGDRFHVAFRYTSPADGVSLDLDDLYVGVLPTSAFDKTPTTGFAAAFANGEVTLTWTAPDVAHTYTREFPFGVHGYNIYRDDMLLGYVPVTTTTYVDKPAFNGTYTYSITAQYKLPIGVSEAETATATVTGADFLVFPPINVNAFATKADTGNDIDIQWGFNDADASISRLTQSNASVWASYNATHAVFAEGEPIDYVETIQAHRYPAEYIMNIGLNGYYIKDVWTYLYPLNRANPPAAPTAFINDNQWQKDFYFMIYIYEGGAVAGDVWKPDGAPVYSQVVDMRGRAGGDNKISLNRMFKIDGTKDLVIAIGHRALAFEETGEVKIAIMTNQGALNHKVNAINAIYRDLKGEWQNWSSTDNRNANRIFIDVVTSSMAAASGVLIDRMDPADVILPIVSKAQNIQSYESALTGLPAMDLPEPEMFANPNKTRAEAPTFTVFGALEGTTPELLTVAPIADKKYEWVAKEDGYYNIQVASQNGGAESRKVDLFYYAGDLPGTLPYINNFNDRKFPPQGWNTYAKDAGAGFAWFRYGTTAEGYAGVRTPSGTKVVDTVMLVSPLFTPSIESGNELKKLTIKYKIRKNGSLANSRYDLRISTSGTDYDDFVYRLCTAADQNMGWGTFAERVHDTHLVYDADEDDDIRVPLANLVKNGGFYLAFFSEVGVNTNLGIDIDDLEITYEEGVSDSEIIAVPLVTALSGNYPNPFNPTTTIQFSIAEETNVAVEIFNIKGQKVKTLVNEKMAPNQYKVVWNGKDNNNNNVSSGIYFYRMKTDNYNETKKMIMLK